MGSMLLVVDPVSDAVVDYILSRVVCLCAEPRHTKQWLLYSSSSRCRDNHHKKLCGAHPLRGLNNSTLQPQLLLGRSSKPEESMVRDCTEGMMQTRQTLEGGIMVLVG
jgi:hypothetical protein